MFLKYKICCRDSNLVDKAIAFRTQLIKRLCARSGALRAGKSPALAHGATALVALVQATDVLCADAQAVVEVTGLIAFIDASGSGRVQCQAFKNKIRINFQESLLSVLPVII